MNQDFIQEQNYLRVKKKVKAIKGFYVHLVVYILVNIFISGIIIFGLTRDGDSSFSEALSNFGVYSTWFFWGIGMFFHWLGVFGFKSIIGSKWEERKIQQLLDKENKRYKNN
ncbi:2TM domain-containing protein [uncultured Polaribacter sp.]|uniref:2TM domain-containing protein n=1 Tax=uncultured Polaribacter sp. TaxID=174711 RepID=UPI002609C556|nr:2TM domain-containing protein [uncultured Polaribacter sp.]